MVASPARREPESEPPIRELLAELGNGAAGLVHDEIALFKREITDGLKAWGRGMALVLGGAVLGLLALFSIGLAVIAALAVDMGWWQAALVVGAPILCLAGIATWAGVKRLRLDLLKPRLTIDSLRKLRNG